MDVILIDPTQSNGFVITAQVKTDFPTVKIIGFSNDGESSKKRMLELGASSYLSKYETSLEELKTIVQSFGCVSSQYKTTSDNL